MSTSETRTRDSHACQKKPLVARWVAQRCMASSPPVLFSEMRVASRAMFILETPGFWRPLLFLLFPFYLAFSIACIGTES